MGNQIVVPSLGESILEATVARWFKKPGESVRVGEPVVELETEKVNLEVGAEQAGVLVRILHPEGEDVKVGEVLGEIGEASQATATPQPPSQPEADKPSGSGPSEQVQTAAAGTGQPVPKDQEPAAQEVKPSDDQITPVARRMIQEMDLPAEEIQGSGPGGRIQRQDIERYLQDTQTGSAKPDLSISVEAQKSEKPAPAQAGAQRPEERVRLSRRRRTIAERLVQAQHSAAMLTTFNDLDMTAVMDIRQKRKEAFKTKYGIGLGIVSFFVKASILALKEFPRLNAEIQGDEMVLKKFYDIGIAVAADEGLIVPVIRDADRLSFVDIEKKIQDFVQKAKDNTFSLEDLAGGTFSITNGGVFGSLLSTPILNYPQVGILGLHRIETRPVAVQGEVIIRPMMYLALSYDHRIVDGKEAVQFLGRIKEAVEHPEILLIEG